MRGQLKKVLLVLGLIAVIMTSVFSYNAFTQDQGIEYFEDNIKMKEENKALPKPVYAIKGPKEHKIKEPLNVIVDNQGYVYVADKELCQIIIYDDEGSFIKSLGRKGEKDGQFKYPYGLVRISDEAIWVSDSENNTVQQFDIKSGKYNKTVISSKENAKPGLMTKHKNKVYISDLLGKRILTYNLQGQKLTEYKGNFSFPQGLVVGKDERLWVGDAGQISTLKVFNKEGILEGFFDSSSDKKNLFYSIRGLAKDSKGRIYVVDTMSNLIKVFDQNGKQLFSFGNDNLSFPMGIYIDENDYIYISDRGNKKIQIWAY